MNTQRITISLPNYLYQQLEKTVPPMKVSKFIAKALEEKLLNQSPAKDPIEDFFALRKKLPKKTTKDILEAIKKGRK
ncbi:hypothetical protein HY407_03060 [Candidatus Gottesmanbacteria bacterium]|nr:hypothetical protein [Candidatus Gottesmanbacteria bacterium]